MVNNNIPKPPSQVFKANVPQRPGAAVNNKPPSQVFKANIPQKPVAGAHINIPKKPSQVYKTNTPQKPVMGAMATNKNPAKMAKSTTAGKSQPSGGKPRAKVNTITYAAIGGILFLVMILYFVTSGGSSNNTHKPDKKPDKPVKQAAPKDDDGIPKGRDMTEDENKRYSEALMKLSEVSKVIAKFSGVQSVDEITEADKTEIKNASKKIDEALGTISDLSELTGTPLLDGGTMHIQNRKKLNEMMRKLDIKRQ